MIKIKKNYLEQAGDLFTLLAFSLLYRDLLTCCCLQKHIRALYHIATNEILGELWCENMIIVKGQI